ncbi:MAG: hypothetical protein J7L43_03065, partial [Candidatus Aenigmarchaeota archaeon]|nr:hypothetical protein [Candidatus Aenigmarchaeota archaeon]
INSIKSSYTPVPPQLYLGNPLAKLEYLLYSSKILDVIESDGKEKLEREFLKTASEISEEIMNSINRDVTVEDYSEQYGENLKYFFENFA